MKSFTSLTIAFVLPAVLAAQTPAPAPVANPITAAFKTRITAMHRNLAQAFDSIPESKFDYKPTPAQLSIGLFQPSVFGGGAGAYDVTKIPRVEAEFTYNQKSGKNNYMFWLGGLWQSTSNAPSGGSTVSSFGGTAGIKAGLSDLSIVVNGYIGKGLGTGLLFSGGEVVLGDTLSKSDGGYAQLMYKVGPKTNLGASWGFSRLKFQDVVVSNVYSYTAGIYHQWTKSLKLVFEGTEEGSTGPGRPKQIDLSGGFMLFF